MTEHRIATQEEWQAERDALLKEEKELTRRGDELTKKRQELPWVEVEKNYEFETEDGTRSLADLFAGRSQLVIYHFMFGPAYETGCPVCSSIADTLAPQVPHLAARDTTLMLVSREATLSMFSLSQQYGLASSPAQRAALEAAGQTLLTTYNSKVRREHNPEYASIQSRAWKLARAGKGEEARKLRIKADVVV